MVSDTDRVVSAYDGENDDFHVILHYSFHGTNDGLGFLDLQPTGKKVITTFLISYSRLSLSLSYNRLSLLL